MKKSEGPLTLVAEPISLRINDDPAAAWVTSASYPLRPPGEGLPQQAKRLLGED